MSARPIRLSGVAVALVAAVLVGLTSLTGPSAAVPPAKSSDDFTAGNVAVPCQVLRGPRHAPGGVACLIDSEESDVGPTRVVLPGRGTTRLDRGDVRPLPGHQVLRPSDTKQVGTIVCTALRRGVSCVNRQGHGFVVRYGKLDERTHYYAPRPLRRF